MIDPVSPSTFPGVQIIVGNQESRRQDARRVEDRQIAQQETAANRQFQGDQASQDRALQASEGAANRASAEGIAAGTQQGFDKQREFQGQQAELDRQVQVAENEKNRMAQQALQTQAEAAQQKMLQQEMQFRKQEQDLARAERKAILEGNEKAANEARAQRLQAAEAIGRIRRDAMRVTTAWTARTAGDKATVERLVKQTGDMALQQSQAFDAASAAAGVAADEAFTRVLTALKSKDLGASTALWGKLEYSQWGMNPSKLVSKDLDTETVGRFSQLLLANVFTESIGRGVGGEAEGAAKMAAQKIVELAQGGGEVLDQEGVRAVVDEMLTKVPEADLAGALAGAVASFESLAASGQGIDGKPMPPSVKAGLERAANLLRATTSEMGLGLEQASQPFVMMQDVISNLMADGVLSAQDANTLRTEAARRGVRADVAEDLATELQAYMDARPQAPDDLRALFAGGPQGVNEVLAGYAGDLGTQEALLQDALLRGQAAGPGGIDISSMLGQ